MALYIVAAVGLTIALLLASLAMKHRSLLDPGTRDDLLRRLDALTATAASRWGHMNAGQMLRHVGGALQMATGDLKIAPRRTPLKFFPLKQLIVFVLPFPKGAPTAPALVVRDEIPFEAERAVVRDLLSTFAQRPIEAWPDHPAFGPLTRDQWGILAWKHVDHHFRQFGV